MSPFLNGGVTLISPYLVMITMGLLKEEEVIMEIKPIVLGQDGLGRNQDLITKLIQK